MNNKKCILAYSGGMDSTISIAWIRKEYNLDVITLTLDLGGGPELDGVKEKAKNAGAIDSLIWDVRDEFVNEYVFKGLKARALYEGKYPLSTALGRPLMAKKLVEAARLVGASSIAHGCTGKGNDQVRFDSSIMTLSAHSDPINIIAPAREWGMTRDEEKKYAQKSGIELREIGNNQKVYSIDRNLWGQAIEGEDLEDTWVIPPEDAYSWTSPMDKTPDNHQDLILDFDQGTPIAINEEEINGVKIIENLNKIAGNHSVGRIDHVENRLVGIKSREIYETPGAVVLHTALNALETMCLSKEQQRVKHNLSQIYADLVYDGKWFTELRANIDSFMSDVLKYTSGKVKVRLFKGSVTVIGIQSNYSLYDFGLATYSSDDNFDHSAATGFIDIYSLSSRTQAKKQTYKDAR